MLLTRIFPIVVLSALTATTALATDRYYSDCFAISPNGRFRIDAKSPENAGANARPFASNFTYTLTDSTTKAVIWRRAQPVSRSKGSPSVHCTERSPTHLFVTDDGLVAARLDTDSLIFLNAKTGSKQSEAEVLDAFPAAQRSRFVGFSSAGPLWSQKSDWYFLSVTTSGGKPSVYFVVRPFWNHRLIVDTATGKHVDLGVHHAASSAADIAAAPADIKRLLTACMEDESRRALSAINIDPASIGKDDWEVHWALRTALHTVAFLKLAEAEPALRRLESPPEAFDRSRRARPAAVREALRAIGKTPVAGYGVAFPAMNPTIPVQLRTENAAKIAIGMSMREMTDLLGWPDAQIDRNRYDYDIDAPEPYTLRITFDRQDLIESTSQIKPFAFVHDPQRMRNDW